MAKPIAVDIPHQLGEAEAKARLVDGLSDARGKYGKFMTHMTETWTGNHMEFSGSVMGQKLSGRIDVKPASVRVEIDVPALLAMIAKKFLPQVEQETRKMLEKKK